MSSTSQREWTLGGVSHGGLGAKLKALLWEECRVAGVIAAWCTIVCVAVLELSQNLVRRVCA